jgi:hypothetical protein
VHYHCRTIVAVLVDDRQQRIAQRIHVLKVLSLPVAPFFVDECHINLGAAASATTIGFIGCTTTVFVATRAAG